MHHHSDHSRHGRRFAHSEGDSHERHGGGRHGGERHRGRHGRSERVFDQGDLRFVMLDLIAEKPRHGYEIIKEIEEQLRGSYSPSPGVIYPTLTLLEELGYLAVAETDGSRKLYRITEEGKAYLHSNAPALAAVRARMAEASASRASSHAPQLIRAMENLKMALRLRTSRGTLTNAEIEAIAGALDGAARLIERV